jgi:Winged helix DNA-binding domain
LLDGPLTADAIRRHRLHAQRLAGAKPAAPAEVVRQLVGIQAQDRAAAALAVAVRAGKAGERGIVRTWAMRGTLHLIAAEDLPLMLAVFGALHLKRAQRRLTQLGLPPDVAERSTAEAASILAEEGPLTRHEIAARLRERGVAVAAEGQAPIHVVHRAAVAGVLIETGVRGREELYGPLDPGPLPDRDAAVAELARRYAAAHAPATADDFAAWSGLPAADIRRAWEDPVLPVGEPGEGPVRLLPAYDEWLLGWASRDLVLPKRHATKVAPGGIIRPVAIADGRAFATWRLDRRRNRIELQPFGRVTRAMRAGVEAEAARMGAVPHPSTFSPQ